MRSWSEFFNKHATPKRLRAAAFTVTTGITAATMFTGGTLGKYMLTVAACGLFAAGNFFFNKGKNKSFGPDLRAS